MFLKETFSKNEKRYYTEYIFNFFENNYPGVTIYQNQLVKIDDLSSSFYNSKVYKEIPMLGECYEHVTENSVRYFFEKRIQNLDVIDYYVARRIIIGKVPTDRMKLKTGSHQPGKRYFEFHRKISKWMD